MGRLIRKIPLESNSTQRATVAEFYAPGEPEEIGSQVVLTQRTSFYSSDGDRGEQIVVMNAQELHDLIRNSLGTLFPLNQVDEVMMAQRVTDHALALVSSKEDELLQMASNTTLMINKLSIGKDAHTLATAIGACIVVAILALRGVEKPSPVQE